MNDSYVAIQGPPGTGKTFTGSRVIKDLVEKHGWRIGVVAQSHAVVENMLAGIVKAGLDPSLVGKGKTESDSPSWTPLTERVEVPRRARCDWVCHRRHGLGLRQREHGRPRQP